MKRTLKWICWLLLPPLLWGGCEKGFLGIKPEGGKELPAVTTEGKNTFGCRINGKVWRNGSQFLHGGISGEYWPPQSLFQIAAKQWRDGDLKASLSLAAYLDEVGEHNLHRGLYWELDSLCIDVADAYHLLEGADNKVHILRLDTREFIVAGTFEFVLTHTDCRDTLYVTDGRFDFKYAQ
jgi:hypothetical protein